MTLRESRLDEVDLDDVGNLEPVAAAVVIGIGGSGIQTITRLRDAVRSERPEEAAIDSIRFVGIDAVDLSQQNPPLPADMGLGTGEFFNLVETPFDAHTYIRNRLASDVFLSEWWDPSYEPPVGPLTEGLKRERMLGRLAFHRAYDHLLPRIHSAITRALEIGAESDEGDRTIVDGENPKVPTIPVYIVNSSTGGTGSAGFLSVVFAVWTAARNRGYYPQIRCFTFLPSVFQTIVFESAQGGQALGMEHDANAFAYFREVDHFLTHGEALGRYLGMGTGVGGVEIPGKNLLKQIYLIGSTMPGVGELTNITDAFSITAEAMYQFLVTKAGMPLVGVDATNTDRALGELDRFDKPRRYCSLGVARVIFPGDTYRRHISNRYVDWYITNGLLNYPKDLRGIVRTDKVTHQLLQSLEARDRRASDLEVDLEVTRFLEYVEFGMAEMQRASDVRTAQDLINKVKRSSPAVVRSLRRSAREHERRLLSEFDAQIADTVFASGYGVPFAVEVLEILAKKLTMIVTATDGSLQTITNARISGEDRVNKLLVQLQNASNRALHEKVVAKIASLAGRADTEEDIAKQLGQAIQSWTKAIHSAELATARANLAREMSDRVATLRSELDEAVHQLRSMAKTAHELWVLDSLEGKDAGPDATTILIPRDAQPEIEDSQRAQEMYQQIVKEHEDRLSGDDLDRFIERWMDQEANRGFFSLGSDTKSEAVAARVTLRASLMRDAKEYALHTGHEPDRRSRLPASLFEAQQESTDVARGIKAMLLLAGSVCLSWEEGRIQLDSPEEGTRSVTPSPTVTSVIAAPRELTSALGEATAAGSKIVEMPDPERIVALSVVWALPIHAIHDIPRWKAQYDRIQRIRSVKPEGHVPVHTDRRFADELNSLVPVYFEQDDVAKQIGQALVFKQLLTDASSGVMDHYDHTRNNPAVPPISLESDGRWRGAVLHVKKGRLSAVKRNVDLGDSWQAMQKSLGENQKLRRSIDDVTAWLTGVIGPKRLLDEAKTFLDNLEALIDESKARPDDAEVLNAVFDAVSSWQVDLRSQSI